EALNTPGAPNSLGDPDAGVCGDPATSIGAVQGDGSTSPLVGQTVEIEGVITGDFQQGGFDGFYVQDEGVGDPATSDGIVVFAPGAGDLTSGDVVRVAGTVEESFEMTRLAQAEIAECGQGPVPDPVTVQLPQDDAAYEATEGMLVTLPQSLAILEYFNYGQFGEIALGVDRQFQPTAVFEPGSTEATQLLADHEAERIILDDGRGESNPDPARHPNGADFALDNIFRGGDLITDATGVLDYRFGQYRVQPTQAATYQAVNPRPDVPEVGGSLTVASFNVLNYFTTLGARGADDAEEFDRQEAKIVAALARLDADVVGLIEIENNGTALDTLVTALNDDVGPGTYAGLTTGPIGTDEITTAFIYQPAKVSLNGEFATLTSADDPRFLDSKNRPALAQTFTETATGESVTVVVNHLKSKGSSCNDVGDPTDPNGQGNCNGVRTAAALALADWVAADPTGSAERDVVVIGDLNAYDKEDPIVALGDAGFVDLLAAEQGELAYSYVFDGQLGYLDYGLANPTAAEQVSGAAVWHINADEASLLDYDTEFKKDPQDAIYAPDPYRSSDHDPVVVGLDLVRRESVERLAGTNRYGTAVTAARQMGDSDLVYVASGHVFPDALAATPLAIRREAPLVLTRRGKLPPQTRDYLADFAPETVVVLGGSGRIDDAVLSQIETVTGAQVGRIAGPNRYATAAELAVDWEGEEIDTVYVASGMMFADALSVGPLAGIEDSPVLLTKEQTLSPETAAALQRLEPRRIIFLGGSTRIGNSVLAAALPYADNVGRLYGADRYETAAKVAARIEVGERAFLASGEGFPDALAGGVVAGSQDAPLLLTPSTTLAPATADSVTDRAPKMVTAVGGPRALQPTVLDAVRALLSP
ncbi:MAG: ExeM/NucH family extracellular endonuclease, partial [Ornithinimicrobium sp.]